MAGHVLFIDQLDSEIIEIKHGLEEEGIRVSVQPNPLQAVNDAKVNVPDVVVTEVLTRPIGGLEIAFAISHGKYGFTAPVIFYTGFYRDERTRRDITVKYGALHYFVKPFHRKALRKAICVILEKSIHFRNGVQEQSGAAAPPQVLPANPAHENEIATQALDSEPVRSERAMVAEGTPVETPPARHRLVFTGPLRKVPEVVADLKSAAPFIPFRIPSVEIFPRSVPVKGEEDNTRIQTPTTPSEYRPDVILPASRGVSPKPTDEKVPIVLPLRPVKEMRWTWAIPGLLLVITFAILLFFGQRFGRSSEAPVNDPPSETNGSASSISPPANLTSAPAEVSHEGGVMLHESVSAYSAKTSSDVSAPAESPSEPPSKPIKETLSQTATPLPRPELLVADISISVRMPQLLHMKKPALSNESLRQVGRGIFVVRVVVDGNGKVREVTPLNGDTQGGSLPQDLLEAIWQWEFKSIGGREGEVFFKHYSFRVAFP